MFTYLLNHNVFSDVTHTPSLLVFKALHHRSKNPQKDPLFRPQFWSEKYIVKAAESLHFVLQVRKLICIHFSVFLKLFSLLFSMSSLSLKFCDCSHIAWSAWRNLTLHGEGGVVGIEPFLFWLQLAFRREEIPISVQTSMHRLWKQRVAAITEKHTLLCLFEALQFLPLFPSSRYTSLVRVCRKHHT